MAVRLIHRYRGLAVLVRSYEQILPVHQRCQLMANPLIVKTENTAAPWAIRLPVRTTATRHRP